MKTIKAVILCGSLLLLSALPAHAASLTLPAAGKIFRDCSTCPEMIMIPAGNFVMGDNRRESGIKQEENKVTISIPILAAQFSGPAHHVNIKISFAVGKYVITFDEWDACVAEGGCGGYQPKAMVWGRGRMPVVNVNWQDAQQYTEWLSKKTGKHYRLLSEAEWEYVAHARTTTTYYWGDQIGLDHANCCGTKWDYSKLAPVGTFAANDFGLYEMLGYVWQWTQDCWHADYNGAPTDGSAWTSSGDCSKRSMRGGDYQSPPHMVRVVNRNFGDPVGRYYGLGFRIARDR